MAGDCKHHFLIQEWGDCPFTKAIQQWLKWPHPNSYDRRTQPGRDSTVGRLRTEPDSRPGNGSRVCPDALSTHRHIPESALNSTIVTNSLLVFHTEYCEAQITFNWFVNCEELNVHEIIIYHTASSRSRDPLLVSGKSDRFVMTEAPASVLNKPKNHDNELKWTGRNDLTLVNQPSSIVLYYY